MLSRISIAVGLFALTAAAQSVPKFEPDPFWPKPLPNNWMLGQVGGIFVDSHDHIWVDSRPRTLDNNDKYAALNPPQADCCIPSPPAGFPLGTRDRFWSARRRG